MQTDARQPLRFAPDTRLYMPDPTLRPLHGKVALVTGGARGIGRAIALKLGTEGADLAINYYNSHAEAEALCAQLQTLGRRAIAIQGSVGVPDSVDEMFATLKSTFDR